MVRRAMLKLRESPLGLYLNGNVPRYQVLPLYLIIVMFAWAGLRWNDSLARTRLEEASEELREQVYVTCVADVTSENNLRETLLAVTALFPDSDGARAITRLIEDEHPPLSMATCLSVLVADHDP